MIKNAHIFCRGWHESRAPRPGLEIACSMHAHKRRTTLLRRGRATNPNVDCRCVTNKTRHVFRHPCTRTKLNPRRRALQNEAFLPPKWDRARREGADFLGYVIVPAVNWLRLFRPQCRRQEVEVLIASLDDQEIKPNWMFHSCACLLSLPFRQKTGAPLQKNSIL